MFPDEPTLIARGKYSTLGSERKKQLERVQNICNTITSAAHNTLRDCEKTPPIEGEHVQAIDKAFKNLLDARMKLIEIGKQMVDIKPTAWPE